MRNIIILCIIFTILLPVKIFCAPIYIDADCVKCHVLGKAINISITHPNLLIGCVTCHSAENLGLHRNRIIELDPRFYNYTGTYANVGCGVCHGEPPFALCIEGIVPDHCLDPSGCTPGIFNCMNCHKNFDGTRYHIYQSIIPFSTIADISRCFLCHGLALNDLLSGAHKKHLTTVLMAPVTTGSTSFTIDCITCHPNLINNLGADHLVCIPGISNANLPGKVPVVFNPLSPQIGGIDSYQLAPIGGTGSCIVYCHSNGATPPAIVTTWGYSGSIGLPVAWNQIFPADPIMLDCFCCHTYPPASHSPSKTDCDKCHPTPLLSPSATNLYHINGVVDLLRFLLSNNFYNSNVSSFIFKNDFINPFLPVIRERSDILQDISPFIWHLHYSTNNIQPLFDEANTLFSLLNGIAAPMPFPFNLYMSRPFMPIL